MHIAMTVIASRPLGRRDDPGPRHRSAGLDCFVALLLAVTEMRQSVNSRRRRCCYTEKYFARLFKITIALVLCSGWSCHSSDSDTPIRSAPRRVISGTWSSSFGQAG